MAGAETSKNNTPQDNTPNPDSEHERGFENIAELFADHGQPDLNTNTNASTQSGQHTQQDQPSRKPTSQPTPVGQEARTHQRHPQNPVTSPYNLGEKETQPLRDPLFAAKVLEQEQGAPAQHTARQEKSGGNKKPAPSPQKKSVLRTIRTYKEDAAQAMRDQQQSVIGMVLEEEKKRQGQQEKEEKGKRRSTFFIIASITLIVLGVGSVVGAVYFVLSKQRTPASTPSIEVPSFFFVEQKKELEITDLSRDQIAKALDTEIDTLNIRLDFIEHVYFTETAADTQGDIKVLTTTKVFFDKINTKIPGALSRALESVFMYGIHVFNGNQPFLVLKTNYFDSAFAGMLEWEPFMARDIFPLFGINPDETLLEADFTDRVIKNRDLRVLVDAENNIRLLYAFFDNQTIIITTSTDTLDEVITRLNRAR